MANIFSAIKDKFYEGDYIISPFSNPAASPRSEFPEEGPPIGRPPVGVGEYPEVGPPGPIGEYPEVGPSGPGTPGGNGEYYTVDPYLAFVNWYVDPRMLYFIDRFFHTPILEIKDAIPEFGLPLYSTGNLSPGTDSLAVIFFLFLVDADAASDILTKPLEVSPVDLGFNSPVDQAPPFFDIFRPTALSQNWLNSLASVIKRFYPSFNPQPAYEYEMPYNQDILTSEQGKHMLAFSLRYFTSLAKKANIKLVKDIDINSLATAIYYSYLFAKKYHIPTPSLSIQYCIGSAIPYNFSLVRNEFVVYLVDGFKIVPNMPERGGKNSPVSAI